MTDPEEDTMNQTPIVPKLRVQRMGKRFRIVYDGNRNLAKFNSGKPVDDGGFKDEIDARIKMSKVLDNFSNGIDSEAEGIG